MVNQETTRTNKNGPIKKQRLKLNHKKIGHAPKAKRLGKIQSQNNRSSAKSEATWRNSITKK